jgi:hypothetical protein
MKTQKCTLCDLPSIPGLKRGHGKCQYHWDRGVWGKEWADKVRADELKKQEGAQSCTDTD